MSKLPTMPLRCKMGDKDKAEKLVELNKIITSLKAVEAEKSEAVSAFNLKIKGLKGTMFTINDFVTANEVEREVEVSIKLEGKMVVTRRTDMSGQAAIVTSRPASEDELNGKLFERGLMPGQADVSGEEPSQEEREQVNAHLDELLSTVKPRKEGRGANGYFVATAEIGAFITEAEGDSRDEALQKLRVKLFSVALMEMRRQETPAAKKAAAKALKEAERATEAADDDDDDGEETTSNGEA